MLSAVVSPRQPCGLARVQDELYVAERPVSKARNCGRRCGTAGGGCISDSWQGVRAAAPCSWSWVFVVSVLRVHVDAIGASLWASQGLARRMRYQWTHLTRTTGCRCPQSSGVLYHAMHCSVVLFFFVDRVQHCELVKKVTWSILYVLSRTAGIVTVTVCDSDHHLSRQAHQPCGTAPAKA